MSAKTISVNLKIWRQPAKDQAGRMVDYVAKDISTEIAYGTPDGGHLLNVRAANMNALADQQNHLIDYLEKRFGKGLSTLEIQIRANAYDD